jgi:hypothetical protein
MTARKENGRIILIAGTKTPLLGADTLEGGKSPPTSLFLRGELKSPFGKGGFRGISTGLEVPPDSLRGMGSGSIPESYFRINVYPRI